MRLLYPYLLATLLLPVGGAALGQSPVGNINPEVKNSSDRATSKERASKDRNRKNSGKNVADKIAGFDEFLNAVNADFEDFRSQVIDNYDKWLAGEWVKFTPEPGRIRYTTPKPKELPVAPGADVAGAKASVNSTTGLESLAASLAPEDAPGVVISSNNREIWGAIGNQTLTAMTHNRDTQRLIKDAQYRRTRPDDHTPGDWFTFYDMDLRIPSYDYQLIATMRPYKYEDKGSHTALRENSAAQWRLLQDEKVGEIVGAELKSLADSMNLNDYLRYELTRSYVNAKFPDASQMSRTALVHYLLVHQGYGPLLGSSDGAAFIVLPAEQQLFQKPAVPNTYNYLFNVDNEDLSKYNLTVNFFCVEPPKNVPGGKSFDFRLDNLKIPELPVDYTAAYGDIVLKGTVNALLMPILHKYPQMSTEGFAESTVDAKFHKDLLDQVKAQVAGLSPEEAAEKLLSFTQWGFDYMTDDEQHGFEKPYFLEENFFYPANDCEDRSIFYTTLLWNVLGLESQLLAYPNHESASVKLPNCIRRDSYYYNYAGEPFVIADPTYQGAPIGIAMDFYENLLPERVDLYLNSVWQEEREKEKEAAQEGNI
ncbi:MAG: hypothetical protein K2O24_06875 [Muribaculaceae bacterium]|nr:hypothetical protein [Muribaculaceae bacterium]